MFLVLLAAAAALCTMYLCILLPSCRFVSTRRGRLREMEGDEGTRILLYICVCTTTSRVTVYATTYRLACRTCVCLGRTLAKVDVIEP